MPRSPDVIVSPQSLLPSTDYTQTSVWFFSRRHNGGIQDASLRPKYSKSRLCFTGSLNSQDLRNLNCICSMCICKRHEEEGKRGFAIPTTFYFLKNTPTSAQVSYRRRRILHCTKDSPLHALKCAMSKL